MTMENPNILYVGDIDRGRALLAAVQAEGGYVYLPAELNEALAMYVFYLPDVVVIDGTTRPILALEAFYHLHSVNAQPMVLLSNGAHSEDVIALPLDADNETILAAAHHALQAQAFKW
jgi:CheY-like chemotaxis protein